MTEPVRVHIRVPGTEPMPRLMKLIQGIEAAGFDGAGILDSQMLSRDTFVILGQAAAHTTRLALFPAVTNPFTRHASVLASAIQTVEELAPGRVRFVIGTGYTSASTIGRSPATLNEMRACIGTVKALLAGTTVDFGGTPGRLGYVSGRHIPVLMAASGAKAIEVAGDLPIVLAEVKPVPITNLTRPGASSSTVWIALARTDAWRVNGLVTAGKRARRVVWAAAWPRMTKVSRLSIWLSRIPAPSKPAASIPWMSFIRRGIGSVPGTRI